MEYTKDIILDIGCKRQIGVDKFKSWTRKIKKQIQANKIISVVLFLLFTLTVIDIILVNSFFNILSNLY